MRRNVYISSTYKDLVVYRDAIRDMFMFKGLQEEFLLVSMEGYLSESGKKALDICLQDVEQADIYILILAKRYGSLIEGTNISYTEAEYNKAKEVQQQRPNYKIFVFYSHEENEAQEFAGMPILENPSLEAFYNKALSQNASFIYPFSNPDNLCKQILLTFNYYFTKPKGLNDFMEALVMIDRIEQSWFFSKSTRQNVNGFYFYSQYDNSPNDFLNRLSGIEMAGKYRKCLMELGQFQTNDYARFRDVFFSQLAAQWQTDLSEFQFKPTDKLFLSFEINALEAASKLKMEFLARVLEEFLPIYLKDGDNTTANRLFVVFYNYQSGASEQNASFTELVEGITASVNHPATMKQISSLGNVTKADAKIWLNVFAHDTPVDEDDLDMMLNVPTTEPFKTFTMKELTRSLKIWIRKNYAITN